MSALERLREGYVRGLIDLETFEYFVGLLLEGGPVMLPVEVASLGPAGPPSAAGFAGVLKEAWSDSRFTWPDGSRGHSISFEQHHANLRQRVLDDARRHYLR